LYAICYAKTSNKEASEEMVQDIFISLWNRKDELTITLSIEHYLIKAAKLKVIDYYRMLATAKHQTLIDCELCNLLECDQNFLQHNDAIHKFLEKDLEITVQNLPLQCQKVYRLSREEQMSISEIAENLNISPKTVKNHLTKALNFIREKIPADFSATVIILYFTKIFL
jgi:RNA polymerase sigma-70 factor (ECF subfamily)